MDLKSFKKDFRTTVTINKHIHNMLKKMGTSPQKIIDEFIEKNISLKIENKSKGESPE